MDVHSEYTNVQKLKQKKRGLLWGPAVRALGCGVLVLGSLVIFAPVLSSFVQGLTDELMSGDLNIEGLRLAMPLEAAGQVMEAHGFPPGSGASPARKPNRDGGEEMNADGWKIVGDPSGNVVAITLYSSTLNKFFGISGLEPSEQASKIAQALGFPNEFPSEERGFVNAYRGLNPHYAYTNQADGWRVEFIATLAEHPVLKAFRLEKSRRVMSTDA